MVHINLADSTEWEALPGIGAVLAGRIVRFREKLGGFHAPAQLLDVFGLRDSTYQLIAPLLLADNLQWKRISINQASEAELSAHPYFRWKLARLIVAYRTAHGPFLQVEELKDIQLITDEVFEKMAPYCQLDDPHFKEYQQHSTNKGISLAREASMQRGINSFKRIKNKSTNEQLLVDFAILQS